MALEEFAEMMTVKNDMVEIEDFIFGYKSIQFQFSEFMLPIKNVFFIQRAFDDQDKILIYFFFIKVFFIYVMIKRWKYLILSNNTTLPHIGPFIIGTIMYELESLINHSKSKLLAGYSLWILIITFNYQLKVSNSMIWIIGVSLMLQLNILLVLKNLDFFDALERSVVELMKIDTLNNYLGE